jgi:hypothetical protein
MTEPHKRPHRHPQYKTAYRVKNWRVYDQALRARGDLTLWLSHDALDAWTPPMTGKRGAPPMYADVAIETALTLQLLFRLPLRQTEGFLSSLLSLMDVTLPCPDHTTLSRRNATVAIQQQIDRASEGPISLLVDSSGLKVCGQGAWHSQKHGEKKFKCWKKLHIGVDAQGQIVASAVTESAEQDPSQVPALLSQVDCVIVRFIGDARYDQEPVYAAVRGHAPEARVIGAKRQAKQGEAAALDVHGMPLSIGGSEREAGAGFRTRRRGGTRCSKTPGCPSPAPCWIKPITPSSGNCSP